MQHSETIVQKNIDIQLPKNPIDYLRKALKVIWDDDKIVKLEFHKLDQFAVREIQTNYRAIAKRMKQELFLKWTHLKTWDKSEGHQYVLSKSEIENAKSPYLQVVYKTPTRRFTHELTLIEVARILKVNSKLPFKEMIEKCNYVDNLHNFEKMLQCYEINERNELQFLYIRYDEKRFGFRASDLKSRMTEDMAIRVLQRGVRNWLTTKRNKQMRRVPGLMSLNGIIREGEFEFVYVLRADRQQENFTLTVKETKRKLTLV